MLLTIFVYRTVYKRLFRGALRCEFCANAAVSHMATDRTLRIGFWMTNREISYIEGIFLLRGGCLLLNKFILMKIHRLSLDIELKKNRMAFFFIYSAVLQLYIFIKHFMIIVLWNKILGSPKCV